MVVPNSTWEVAARFVVHVTVAAVVPTLLVVTLERVSEVGGGGSVGFEGVEVPTAPPQPL